MKPPIRSNGVRTADDLKARCFVDADTGCWHWRMGRTSQGRPSLWLPAIARRSTLGVAACLLRTGLAPKPGTAWHSICGNIDCANPWHRTEGTRSTQMLALGMKRTPLQIARGTAARRRVGKLSDNDVLSIRACGLTLKEIAERWRITVGYACEVRSGKVRGDIAAPNSSVWALRA